MKQEYLPMDTAVYTKIRRILMYRAYTDGNDRR